MGESRACHSGWGDVNNETTFFINYSRLVIKKGILFYLRFLSFLSFFLSSSLGADGNRFYH